MRGTNPARPQELSDGSRLWVQEVFYTLQGEGPFTGHPAVFVRLSGCNLRCFFCDTDFESSKWEPSLNELLDVIEKERPEHCNLIVMTGGEPFRQNIRPLVTELLRRGLKVQIETNGTLWVDLPDTPDIYIVCSPKTAYLDPTIKERTRAFKYLVSADETSNVDGLPEKSTQGAGAPCKIHRPTGAAEIYVMPVDTGVPELNEKNTRAAVETAKQFGYKLTLQTHKFAGFR